MKLHAPRWWPKPKDTRDSNETAFNATRAEYVVVNTGSGEDPWHYEDYDKACEVATEAAQDGSEWAVLRMKDGTTDPKDFDLMCIHGGDE